MSDKKFHFNPETGETGYCNPVATGICGFATDGEVPEHYETAEAARDAYAKAANLGTITTVKKPKRRATLTQKTLHATTYQESTRNGITIITPEADGKFTPAFVENYTQMFAFDKYDEVAKELEKRGLRTDSDAFTLNSDLSSLRKLYPQSFAAIDKAYPANTAFKPAEYLGNLEKLITAEHQQQTKQFWSEQKPQNIPA